MKTVKENLLEIKENIAPYKPNIIAVTKYFDETKLIEAYDAGLRNFAESRANEAVEKINRLPEEVRNNSVFHFIGHLQSNKIKKVVGVFHYIHSIDSLKLADAVSKEAISQKVNQKILLQVNNANEEQKFGFSKEELFEVFPKIIALKNLQVVGLMNMTPLNSQENTRLELFKEIAQMKDELNRVYGTCLKELSMGMSLDYEEAVVAGATMIRVGRKLFST